MTVVLRIFVSKPSCINLDLIGATVFQEKKYWGKGTNAFHIII